MNTDDRGSKRARFAEQCEGVEELAANAEEQHLDADVEARVAPELMQQEKTSMYSFASSKTEVFEKIEESLRQCKRGRRSQ